MGGIYVHLITNFHFLLWTFWNTYTSTKNRITSSHSYPLLSSKFQSTYPFLSKSFSRHNHNAVIDTKIVLSNDLTSLSFIHVYFTHWHFSTTTSIAFFLLSPPSPGPGAAPFRSGEPPPAQPGAASSSTCLSAWLRSRDRALFPYWRLFINLREILSLFHSSQARQKIIIANLSPSPDFKIPPGYSLFYFHCGL